MHDTNGQRGTQVKETTMGELTVTHDAERAIAAAASEKQHEVQSAIAIAKRFPRNEGDAFSKLMKAAERPSFAEDAEYRFPRGTKEDGTKNYVSGPSVNLAREAARVWGNVRFGLDIVRDDAQSRMIRGWAWDVETNVKVSAEDEFSKLIQRKKNGRTEWVAPDERDLRELTNRRGSILVRNCILQILPKDLIEDAMSLCAQTLEAGAKADPEMARKKLIVDFGRIGIAPSMLEQKLGHPIAQAIPQELADLRSIYKSIVDGNSTWADYIGEQGPATETGEAPKSKGDSVLSKMQPAPSTPAPAAAPRAPESAPAAGPVTGSEDSGQHPGYDAKWLSDVMDAEDFLRGTTQGTGTLRSIKAGFHFEGENYPLLKEQQDEYLSMIQSAVKRMQKK